MIKKSILFIIYISSWFVFPIFHGDYNDQDIFSSYILTQHIMNIMLTLSTICYNLLLIKEYKKEKLLYILLIIFISNSFIILINSSFIFNFLEIIHIIFHYGLFIFLMILNIYLYKKYKNKEC